jgi:hypothetical protein
MFKAGDLVRCTLGARWYTVPTYTYNVPSLHQTKTLEAGSIGMVVGELIYNLGSGTRYGWCVLHDRTLYVQVATYMEPVDI